MADGGVTGVAERGPWYRHQSFAYAAVSESDVLRALISDRREALRAWFDATYAGRSFLLGSGRASLRAVLLASGIGADDEVVTCGFTCLAVPEAVMYAGAVPVYADLQRGGWSSGVEEIERVATSRTRAVIVQHTFGIPAPIAAIVQVARQRGWVVIEDCALALGSSIDGVPIGVHGDAAIFSFEMTKTIAAGWGGIAVTRAPALSERLRLAYGAEPQLPAWRVAREALQIIASTTLYRRNVLGASRYLLAALYGSGLFRMSGRPLQQRVPANWSYRLPRVHAALAHGQLSQIACLKRRSAQIAAHYREWLARTGRPDVSGPATEHVYLLRFPLLVSNRATSSRPTRAAAE